MRREDVTREQAEAISQKIRPMLGYLNRLKKRMNAVFVRDDPLFAEVIDAADAMHTLWVHLHYRACGMSRPRESGGSDSAGTNTGGSP